MNSYKYDVAFSFQGKDEVLTAKMRDELEGRLSTFFYPRNQEDVSGTDGSEAFDRVFGEEARIVVLVFSAGWGERGWTAIEQSAIQRRGLRDGWDFLQVLPVDPGRLPIPKFIPPLHIYFDWHRHGIEGACAVIEAHVRRHGGEPQDPTFEAVALKERRALELAQARATFKASADSEAWAAQEAHNVKTIIKNKASQSSLKIGFRDESMLNLYGPRGAYMAVGWAIRPNHGGMHFASLRGSAQADTEWYEPDLDSMGQRVWRGKGGRALNSGQLADHILMRLISGVREEGEST